MSTAAEIGLIKLVHEDASGRLQEATFIPDIGMNLVSFQLNSYEVMDPYSIDLFEERYAGLGALIGPHFHRRPESEVPPLPKEDMFPHVAKMKAKGVSDPFSHGIARYVPWKYTVKDNRLFACVDGSDTYDGVPLKEIEGQDFRMTMEAELTERGLAIRLRVAGEKPTVCGLHYYYRIPEEDSEVFVSSSAIKKEYRAPDGSMKKMPNDWIGVMRDPNANEREVMTIPVKGAMDHSFFPSQPFSYMTMRNEDYMLFIAQENAENKLWQVFHPENASYVCIEPISCANPRKPESNQNEISVLLNIGTAPDPQEETE